MDLRDIFIASALLVMFPCCLRKPQIGLLGWLWISIMNPHKESFGFITSMPVLDGLAAFTILGCIINWKDRAEAEFLPVLKVLLAFYIWCTLTTIFAVHPGAAWIRWEEFSKTLLLTMLMLRFMNKKHWIVAACGVFVLAMSFTALKGGLFTVVTGGAHRVWGPPNAVWGSNNGVSLAMVMLIPLALGMSKVFERRLFQMAPLFVALCAFLAVLGTQSRGGLVGLLAMGGAMVLRSKKKFLAIVLVPVVLATGFVFMPQSWHNRMATILTPTEEGSANTRLIQWKYAIDISLERPLFGNGFDAFFHQPYYRRYVAGKDSNRAVHSNVFQVLGEQGYIGLSLYVMLFALTVLTSRKYALLAKGRKDLVWASSLVGMMQFSVIGCAFNGATLNLAYLDLFYYVLAFNVLLCSYIRKELGIQPVVRKKVRKMGPPDMPRPQVGYGEGRLSRHASLQGSRRHLSH